MFWRTQETKLPDYCAVSWRTIRDRATRRRPRMPCSAEITANFASHLCYMAHVQPPPFAVLCPKGRDARGRAAHTHYTYGQLDAESDRIAQALSALGIGPGVRTVFLVKPRLDFLAFAFA